MRRRLWKCRSSRRKRNRQLLRLHQLQDRENSPASLPSALLRLHLLLPPRPPVLVLESLRNYLRLVCRLSLPRLPRRYNQRHRLPQRQGNLRRCLRPMRMCPLRQHRLRRQPPFLFSIPEPSRDKLQPPIRLGNSRSYSSLSRLQQLLGLRLQRRRVPTKILANSRKCSSPCRKHYKLSRRLRCVLLLRRRNGNPASSRKSFRSLSSRPATVRPTSRSPIARQTRASSLSSSISP